MPLRQPCFVSLGQPRRALLQSRVADAAAAHHIVIREWQRIQAELLAEMLVPLEAVLGEPQEFLHLSSPNAFKLLERLLDVVRGGKRTRELYAVLERHARAGPDG